MRRRQRAERGGDARGGGGAVRQDADDPVAVQCAWVWTVRRRQPDDRGGRGDVRFYLDQGDGGAPLREYEDAVHGPWGNGVAMMGRVRTEALLQADRGCRQEEHSHSEAYQLLLGSFPMRISVIIVC